MCFSTMEPSIHHTYLLYLFKEVKDPACSTSDLYHKQSPHTIYMKTPYQHMELPDIRWFITVMSMRITNT